jgi:enoyl-CoA hydratase/carnithine racemase
MGTLMSAPYEHILYEVANDVAHIILNRPDKLNAIGALTRTEIAAALTVASDDSGIGCVLCRG